ncbi:UDP-N-acetylglucosamine 1-carboxyvinyltransferase [Candidatus Uhrbacteria bacterium]|nr:UDP-N-acetylglucosamine 1-carboxyvinyltransferase [Candidatus Uhrbacteria bacterium]
MKMRIRGGKHLRGRVPIFGAKNASGPLIAASLLLKGPVRFKNVPRLTDLLGLLEIMQGMGVNVEWEGDHELMIDASELDASKLDKKKMKRMRFSILLLGPMLARAKKVSVGEPGGCSIGNRPIDAHLFALGKLGAEIETDDDGTLAMRAKELKGAYVILPEFSVTATENLLMAAVTASGHTSIRMAAAEPHVQDLCRFLNACGAKIKGIGSHELEIDGVKELKAPKKAWTVIPDMLEVGTFAVAAAITRGDIEMAPVDLSHLDAVLSLLSRIGVKHEVLKDGALRVQGVSRMQAVSKIQALIYPGFPTDLQALFGLLATQCHGTTLIQDPLFEGRMGYVNELLKMGANAVIADPHRVVITGPTPLRGTEIRSLDLRAGATMVLAGLIAEGETIIHDAEMVYRGYEDLDGRLRALGAEIEQMHE